MGSITGPIGCVNYGDLKEPPVWYILDTIGGQRHQAGAWWTDKPGCGPTTHHQRHLDIEGGSVNLRDPEPGEVIAVWYDYVKQFGPDPCGRAQIDLVNVSTNEIRALVINTGITCPKPAAVVTPPKIITPPTIAPPTVIEEIPIDPPFIPPDDQPPTVVPEPATLVLLGTGAALSMMRRRWRRS